MNFFWAELWPVAQFDSLPLICCTGAFGGTHGRYFSGDALKNRAKDRGQSLWWWLLCDGMFHPPHVRGGAATRKNKWVQEEYDDKEEWFTCSQACCVPAEPSCALEQSLQRFSRGRLNAPLKRSWTFSVSARICSFGQFAEKESGNVLGLPVNIQSALPSPWWWWNKILWPWPASGDSILHSQRWDSIFSKKWQWEKRLRPPQYATVQVKSERCHLGWNNWNSCRWASQIHVFVCVLIRTTDGCFDLFAMVSNKCWSSPSSFDVQPHHVLSPSAAVASSSNSSSRLSTIGWWMGCSSPLPALDRTSIHRCWSSSASALKNRVRWLWEILKACRRSRRSHGSGRETSKPIRGMLRCAFTSWRENT